VRNNPNGGASTYLEICFPFEENFWGKDILFNPFSHIWRHISPFEVFGGKNTLFKPFLHIWRQALCMRDAKWHC
jgi:hypothetical protein